MKPWFSVTLWLVLLLNAAGCAAPAAPAAPASTATPKLFAAPANPSAAYTATAEAYRLQHITPTVTATPWPEGLPSLRELAGQRDSRPPFYIGAAVQAGLLKDNKAYAATVAREFNILTAEYEMKMCIIWPARDQWNFAPADEIVQFAVDHDMKVRGHTLVWTDCLPEWISEGKWTADEAKGLLREYITTVVGRYKGKVAYWDVINESFERPPVWQDLIGKDYERLAFEWAHEADPGALLFYNDYNAEGMNFKAGRVYQMVKGWLDEGVPIHGVGLQAHFKGPVNAADLSANIDRLNALGLEVHITELDIPQFNRDRPAEVQAEQYAAVLKACLEAKNCPVLVIWGFSDAHSWLNSPEQSPGSNPLIFDEQYRPKPAYEALYRILGGK